MVLDDGLHPSTRMRIDHVLAVPGRGGFFHDDAKAIAAGAQQEGFSYLGEPTTPGHRKIRQAGEALSVLLVLSDGQVAHGDCAAVQYSGVGGRDPIFSAADARQAVTGAVASLITGSPVDTFRELATEVDSLQTNGTPLHTAVRYGVTQALLHATALNRHHTMAEVVRDDYDTGVDLRPVPMFVQSGDDRRGAVDKMILKRADVLPHGLINEVSTKLGHDGGLFLAYVTWVRDRILALRDDETYTPTLHFDVYGTIGVAFADDPDRIVSYLEQVEAAARPFLVRVCRCRVNPDPLVPLGFEGSSQHPAVDGEVLRWVVGVGNVSWMLRRGTGRCWPLVSGRWWRAAAWGSRERRGIGGAPRPVVWCPPGWLRRCGTTDICLCLSGSGSARCAGRAWGCGRSRRCWPGARRR